MGKTFRAGVCLAALVALSSTDALARHSSNCADPSEVSALQTAAVQQELMDSALGCGQRFLEKFNAFQTSYGPELRRSDSVLLTFFKRLYGPSRGDAAYNLFKTNMASKAEMRRVRNITDFCSSADLVFAAALAADKPALSDFVSGVKIDDTDESPVGACQITVAVTLHGVMAGPDRLPKPNPLRTVATEVLPSPASLSMGAAPAPAPQAIPVAATAPEQPKASEKPKDKKSGFLSGLFGN
ncbi:MAG: hypothetical protein JO261_16080 [Alphaproteobacteria bacterium]|nr:hypothetical protein [Alphaproteobacteria bacterium]MBV9695211.1 hypothetical protein [Alphaproteobacteria bacterium]